MLSVRPCKIEEMPVLLALYREAKQEPMRIESLYTMVLCDDIGPIGFFAFDRIMQVANLWHFFITERERDYSKGLFLYNALVRTIRRLGMKELVFHAEAESNMMKMALFVFRHYKKYLYYTQEKMQFYRVEV